MSSLIGLWEASKEQHRADAFAMENKFRRNFEKTFSLLLRPFFWRFARERSAIRDELKKIVNKYAPQIRIELTRFENGFYQWEKENSKTGISGSEEAIFKERTGRHNAEELSTEMITKINAIPKYSWYFHPIENPAKMFSNPYPGYLTTERGKNYCDYLVKVFG